MKSIVFLLMCLGALSLGLLVSSRAVLIGAGPMKETGIGAKTFECHFFTGTGVITRTFVDEPTGLVGRDTCPRILTL
jgi:hypothetical protein